MAKASRVFILAALALLPASAANAQGATSAAATAGARGAAPPLGAVPEVWALDVTITGPPVFWTSPTQLRPDAPVYRSTFEIDLVEVTVEFLSIPFGPVDVTDEIPPEQRVISAEIRGPAPLVLVDSAVVTPPAPEPPSVAADLFVGLDANGSGSFAATNITLGTVDVDLGFPFGTVTATITAIHIVGSLSVAATQWFGLEDALAWAVPARGPGPTEPPAREPLPGSRQAALRPGELARVVA